MSRAGVIALLLVATALGGCAGGVRDGAAPASGAATSGADAVDHTLLVDVQRSRAAAGRGVLEVRLRTTGDAAVEVTRLQLIDGRFAPVPPVPKSTTVRPGEVGIITPIPASDPICEAGPEGRPEMAVSFLAGGVTVDVVVAVGDAGNDVLTAIHTEECGRRELLAAADLGFGDDWVTVSPATARGTIRLARTTASEPLVLEQVQGTVILSLRVLDGVGDGPVATLPAGETATEVGVEVSAARCDPHALIESKKTYVFPMWVRRGDAPVMFLAVEPAGPSRAAFEALIREGCHLEE